MLRQTSGSSSFSRFIFPNLPLQNAERWACSTATRLRADWMRRISARLLGSSSIENSDVALLLLRHLAAHRREPLLFLRGILGNLLVRVGEHLFVVGAHGTDVGAAPAAGHH